MIEDNNEKEIIDYTAQRDALKQQQANPAAAAQPSSQRATPLSPKRYQEKRAAQTPEDSSLDHTINIPAVQVYKKNNWSIEIPLVPTFTFENMDMASNRFSHAAAMSLCENIGSLYNPFFIYGDTGTGKTHFLNALGYDLSKKVPQDRILITNGVRFSRGVQRFVEEGQLDKLEKFFNNAEVLIIDDIHLTAVNDHNREFISNLLNQFLKEKRQIIISSKYPPESLARFEELVNFRLDQGWVSEMKPPRTQRLAKIYNKMVFDAELSLSDTQTQSYFGGTGINLGTVARNIRRVKVLNRKITDSGVSSPGYDQLLVEMLGMTDDSRSKIVTRDIKEIVTLPRPQGTDWGRFGFFFPQDNTDKLNWVAFAIIERAKELGIRGGFRFTLKSSYSTNHLISAAFKIANICDDKNLKGAIILGPSGVGIAPAIRENFYDILTHMLEVMMIRCAIIDPETIKRPSSYTKLLGDVLR